MNYKQTKHLWHLTDTDPTFVLHKIKERMMYYLVLIQCYNILHIMLVQGKESLQT